MFLLAWFSRNFPRSNGIKAKLKNSHCVSNHLLLVTNTFFNSHKRLWYSLFFATWNVRSGRVHGAFICAAVHLLGPWHGQRNVCLLLCLADVRWLIVTCLECYWNFVLMLHDNHLRTERDRVDALLMKWSLTSVVDSNGNERDVSWLRSMLIFHM